MSTKPEEKLFWGDYSAGKKPHIWFHRLEGKFDNKTPVATKMYRFEKALEPGRWAELWFKNLPATSQVDWDALYTVFTVKWPLQKVVESTHEELLEKLHATMLNKVNIGGMVDRDGDKVYTHVAWADEVQALTDALDDANGYLIPQVHHNIRKKGFALRMS
ncbi:hypothetical protein CVT25_010077 [Psilocybe cyanescens]|uniref:Uncharacterized protein n=1 Tax=Psilocybe cyanescens TaxID=93625 RepID=A0A409XTR0_PSICY|nr:hypothetical protein CVT25_010077 [Psilocybe cyanescens]